MTFAKWDKQAPIYGVSAEQAMKNNAKYRTEDSYVFYNDDGSIYDLVPVSSLPAGDTADIRCTAFLTLRTASQAVQPSTNDRLTALEAAMLAVMGSGN